MGLYHRRFKRKREEVAPAKRITQIQAEIRELAAEIKRLRALKPAEPVVVRETYVSPNWSYTFLHPKTGCRLRGTTATSDKRAAKTLYEHAQRQAALEAAGLVDPHEPHYKRPLAQHLADWRAARQAEGLTAKQVAQVDRRARAVLEGCGFRLWPDIDASRVQLFIGELRDRDRRRGEQCRGAGPRTRNTYLQAVKKFCQWMVTERRAPQNPLAHLKRENANVDHRHDRRALDQEELRSLLETTRTGPDRLGMAGEARYWLYRLAVETGLRLSELASLTRRSLDLKGKPPTVTVRAAYAKARREDTLPLRPPTAAMLGRWLAHRGRGRVKAPIFNLPHLSNIAGILRADLEAGRQAWIDDAPDPAERERREATSFLVYRDDADRFADFHALRHTFITNLARGGVEPKIAQDLARHKDINLTLSVYTHTVLRDRALALEALPDVCGPEGEGLSRPATGQAAGGAKGA